MNNETTAKNNDKNALPRMEFFTTSCPKCGASLEAENGIDSFYCRFCGAKVILNQDTETINNRLKVRKAARKEKLLDAITSKIEDSFSQETKEEKARIKAEKKKKTLKVLKWIGIIYLILAVFSFAIVGITTGFGNKTNEKEDAKLQLVLEEIQEDISNQKYDEALIKATTLYYSGYDSNKQKWDNIRESLIEQIQSMKDSGASD